jgi:phosphoglycerate dehydrogenase-like enzyme
VVRIAVLDDYQRRAREFADWESLGPRAEVTFFHEPIERSALADTLAEFDALVLMRERTAFPRQVLERLPKLQLVVTTGMRNASLDAAYLRQRGVVVSGTGGVGRDSARGLPSTVEVAWALIFAVYKRVTIEDRRCGPGTGNSTCRATWPVRHSDSLGWGGSEGRWSGRPACSGWR